MHALADTRAPHTLVDAAVGPVGLLGVVLELGGLASIVAHHVNPVHQVADLQAPRGQFWLRRASPKACPTESNPCSAWALGSLV
jgi:hypothetical protein